MKKLLLLSSLFLFLFNTSFSQDKKVELIKKDNTNIKNINNNQVVYPTVIKKPIGFAISKPLRDAPVVSDDYFSENITAPWNHYRDRELNPDIILQNDLITDPVQQNKPGSINNSKGINLNFPGQSSPYYPPDCSGTTGPSHFFQVVNSTYEIFDKSGNSVTGPSPLNSIFDSGLPGAGENDGDPIVLWDEQADRWFYVEFSLSSNDYMLIAVSTTNDPTGTWYSWSYDVADTPDYMKLGVWQDGYYMATNTGSGTDVYAFDRDAMLAGDANPTMIAFDNPNRPSTFDGFHCILPLDNDGPWAPGGTPGQFVTIADDGQGNAADELRIYELNADWATPLNSTFSMTQQLTVASFDGNFTGNWDNIFQPGTSQRLDAISTILMFRAQYRNFSGTEKMVLNHCIDVNGDGSQGAIRWYELENTGSGWSITQQSTYNPDGLSRFVGSIAMNDFGQIALGYSVSDATSVYPGIRFIGQSTCAPLNTMDIAETTILTGANSQTVANRWGDYSQMSVDPSDGLTFWFTTEYIGSGGTRETQISSFTLDEACNPPSVTNVTPTSLFEDRGKQLTITGSDLLGCTFDIGGISGTVFSNDGSTAVIDFPAGNYSDGTLTVTNGAGFDDSQTITINTRLIIPVDASTGANTDIHQTIDAALDGLHAWYGTTAFDAGDLAGTKTIEVTSGTYTESITLNSELNPTAGNPLMIQPASGNIVTIDATANNYGFDLSTVDYVQLYGFEVHSADLANIYLQGDNCEVYLNKLYNGSSASGIKIETGISNNIHNNLIYNNERYAVHIMNSNDNNIENNTTYTNGGLTNPPQNVSLFSDDFETDLSQWTPGNWGLWSGAAHTGALAMGIFNSSGSSTSNSFSVSGYTNIEISVWISSIGNLQASHLLSAEYSFDGGAWTSFVNINGVNNPYAEYTTGPIANAGGTTYSNMQVRFTANVNGSGRYWMVDDLSIIGDDVIPAGNIGSELYVESGTGTTVENNIFFAKNGTDYYTLQTEAGVTVISDYNTYYPNGNTNLVNYNGTLYADIAAWTGNGAGVNDQESDPDFVNAGTDFHLNSTSDSYHGGEWPPSSATIGTWTTDGSDSPGIDTGNPADGYANEPANNGDRINQGAYGNTVQASKSAGIIPDITWTGLVSSEWQNTGNWDLASVPLSTENVLIPNGCPNYPIINEGISTIAVSNTITIETGASLTIDVDGYMTVSGTIYNNAGTSGLLINSDATNGSGSLIQNSSGGVDATVQLYFDATTAQYHMISSPINNAPLTLFPTTNNLNYYDESTNDYWTGPIYETGSISGWTPPVGNLENTRGYLYYYYQTTLNFAGQLNDNTTSGAIPVSYTDHGISAPHGPSYDLYDGWNLIGNPYTSAIDWDNTGVGHATANLLDAIYTYDGVSYTSYVNGTGTNGGTQYIPAMQGFYVKGDPTETSGVLDIPAGALVHNDQAYWKSGKETPDNFIRLQISGNGFSDETVVRFLENATSGPDDGMDAYKLFSWDEAVPQIFTNSTGSYDYSINTLAEPAEGSITIPLKAFQTVDNYSINISEFNFIEMKVYLKDNLLNETNEIGLNDVIELTADETDGTDRFELIFEKSALSVPQAFNTSVVLFPNPNSGIFYLTIGNKASNYTVEVTNITGQIVYKNTFEDNFTKEINMDSQSSGVYFVKIKFSDNSVVNKKIIIQ